MVKRSLNIGIFELLPAEGSYNVVDFFNSYSREKLNSEGVRIASYKESKYLMSEFKKLRVYGFLKNYYYTFITEITIVYDPFGTGRYKEAIIDDPMEVIKFLEGEPALGYDSDGDEDEFWDGMAKITDWRKESSIFFLVRPL